MIDITILGTAATMPLPERALSSCLLSCSGNTILFDCGEGTQTAARKAHVSLMKVSIIALSHMHGDHVFGLPGLLQTMGCLGRTEPLYITGPEGFTDVLKLLLQLAGPMPYDICALNIPDSGLQLSKVIPGWQEEAMLIPFATKHRVSSVGYRFALSRPGKFNPEAAKRLGVPVRQWNTLQHGEDVWLDDSTLITSDMVLGPARKGLSFVFSGDTAPCENLITASRDCDLLLCEATYGEEENSSQADKFGHSTFAQSAEVAAAAGAKRLLLTHFSQMMETPEDCLPNARAIYPGVECACDGLRITLRFPEN